MTRRWQMVMWTTLAGILGPLTHGALAEDTPAVKLQIDGSTTVGPIAEAFAEAFRKMYKNLDITVNKTGSGDGAAALIDGRCDIATMSRFMKDTEFKQAVEKGVMPVAHVIAMDGVMPTRRTIASGTYPLARPLFLFTNGYPKPGSAVFAFVTHHLTEKGQEAIEAKGFMPVTNY